MPTSSTIGLDEHNQRSFVINHAAGASEYNNEGFRIGRQSKHLQAVSSIYPVAREAFGQSVDKGHAKYRLQFSQIAFLYLFDVPHPQPQESN